MGQLVTTAQAAALVGRHERNVRRRIALGELPAQKDGAAGFRIDSDDLAAIPGWRVDRALLARIAADERATPSVLAARLGEVEHELADLRLRVRAIEGRPLIGAPSTPDAPQRPTAPATMYAPVEPLRPSYGAYIATDGARVLLGPFADRHGVPATTAKSQALSQHAYPITSAPRPNRPGQREHYLADTDQQRAALAYWRAGAPGYHECDESGCLCHEAF